MNPGVSVQNTAHKCHDRFWITVLNFKAVMLI
jgi:hypothetical protein